MAEVAIGLVLIAVIVGILAALVLAGVGVVQVLRDARDAITTAWRRPPRR